LVRKASSVELRVQEYRTPLVGHHQALSDREAVQQFEDSEHRERRLEAPDVNQQRLVTRVSPVPTELLTATGMFALRPVRMRGLISCHRQLAPFEAQATTEPND
jgi:hypothetical protein